MLKGIVLLSSLLVTSMTAHAGLIQYGDYKRDSASIIVTGGGLEWLKWDVTKGMSINSALVAYAGQGYRVASNNEVTALFQHFKFGRTDWTAANDRQEGATDWGIGEDNAFNSFHSLFGHTIKMSCGYLSSEYCYSDSDPFEISAALYNVDGIASDTAHAYVMDDYTYFYEIGGHIAQHNAVAFRDVWRGWDFTNYSDGLFGVALVRGGARVVPTPGSIGLLALGLVALGYRRRQV